MSGVLGQIRAGIRRRRLQAVVIAVIVLLASGTITLGLTLLQTASDPWNSAFEAQKGAHLAVTYDARHVSAEQLRATPSLVQATASGGPWPATAAQFERGDQKYQLNVIGRDDPGGQVEVLNVVGGRWVTGPGEIVVTRSFAELNRIGLGDRLTSISIPDKPGFVVVGEAVDIDEGDARTSSQSIWMTEAQASTFGTKPGFRMVYRFAQAPADAQLRDAVAALRTSLPPGAVADSVNYLLLRRVFTVINQILLTFLIAFGLFALAASAATVINLVTGIVLASYREIGILKAIGFTPGQVVAAISGQMLLPSLAGCAVGIPAGTLLSLPLVQRAAQGLGLASAPGFSPWMDLLALAGTAIVVLAAATLPAVRAGRLSAVRAISLGSAPQSGRRSRFGRWLARLGLPRAVSLGAGDALRRPLRGTLTGIAILVGVSTLVFAVGLQRSTATFAAKASLTDTVDVIVQRSDAYPDAQMTSFLSAQPETKRVVAVAAGQALLPGVADPVNVTAYRGDSEQLGLPVVAGRWYQGSREVLAPRATLEEAHLHIGDSVTATIGGTAVVVRIVGEVFSLTNLGHELVMDFATLAAATPEASPQTYFVKLRPGADAAAFADRVHAAEPDFLSVQLTKTSSVSTADIFNSVIAAVAVVLAVIALASVFNTMLLNTRERRPDVAILKTLGMTPRQVLVMVASTACAVGLVAGLVGVPAGVAVHRALLTKLGDFSGNDLPPVAFDVFNPALLTALGLAGLAFALIGSLLPAYWAARAGVAEVLHTE